MNTTVVLSPGLAGNKPPYVSPLCFAPTISSSPEPIGKCGTGYETPCLSHGDLEASHALLRGQGRTTFVGCHFYYPEGPFVPKDFKDQGRPVVYCDGNGLTVSGCDFAGAKQNHVVLGPRAKGTVITGTRFLSGMKLENQGKGKVEAGLNIDE